ncbi:MAG: hypothetical protein JNK32_06685 [Anaerolineales bacterium]|nr:hypothetical protein [Anaerolineales bacterium]
MATSLWTSNSPQSFWQCCPDLPAEIWDRAVQQALWTLGAPNEITRLDEILEYCLGEGRFGNDRYTIGASGGLYYLLKPLLPFSLKNKLRWFYNSFKNKTFPLGWPVELRYAKFQWEVLRQVMLLSGQQEIAFRYFWPEGRRFSFVLTHDIEAAKGQSLVPVLADMEEELGFRSMFNFVPELYPLDWGLIRDLQKRGFEVGVHGLHHDSKLFDTHEHFSQRVGRINQYMHAFHAQGFRSPLTMRNPEWMQMLEMEYDLSFFDTDPYEPMPGGVMSLWPFSIGRFMELPYTLPQDSTLFNILGETSPKIWLEKIRSIREYYGMVLMIVHPDYSAEGKNRDIYKNFLLEMKESAEYWHALPKDVAPWWKKRMQGISDADSYMAHARLNGSTIDILC